MNGLYYSASTYLWWNDTTLSAATTFWRDSLYVVGGPLTVKCDGAIDPIFNIDNSFMATTDTVINDTIRTTKLIIVDRDPANALFEDTLRTDRIRAVAWQEYAGSADPAHCHEGLATYNPHWNHYWDIFVNSLGDTCQDTRFPCENRYGMDTGIMQIYREFDTTDVVTGWEAFFNGADRLPSGYIRVNWDSLAWNWNINIYNGIYIHDVYMPAKFTEEQRPFPDSCSFSACDTFPTQKNKEDLKSYGYHRGENYMKQVKTDKDWAEFIAKKTNRQEYHVYVQNVRKFTYRRPWGE